MAAVTLKDLAKETGLAVSTVSYALRGAPNVPPSTAARVRAAAGRLGYRMNARVAELMAQVRRGRGPDSGDRLALVWVEKKPARGIGFEVEAGARSRAADLGYGLESFTLSETRGNARRLADILQARGIAGVVFAPLFGQERVSLEWPWDRFAMAVIGTAEWNAPLSRAAHHHYEAMRAAMAALTREGVKNPAAWIDRGTNERAHRGWQAAWLAYGAPKAANRIWLSEETSGVAEAKAWLEKTKPDGLVVNNAGNLAALRAAGWKADATNTVLLDWQPGTGVAGVRQGYDTIAAHAVDLVIAQLHRNERGLPQPPRSLLFPGHWVAT